MRWKFWKRPPSLRISDNFPIKKKRRFGLLYERHGGIELFTITLLGVTLKVTLGLVISLALTVASIIYAIVSKPKKPEALKSSADFGNSGFLVNLTSQNEPVRVVYGQFRTGGVVVYKSSTGTDNEHLHMIIALSEGPVEGIAIDGQGEKIWFFDKRIQEFGDTVHWEFFSGAYNQNVCGWLHALDPNWNDAMRGLPTCMLNSTMTRLSIPRNLK